MKLSRYRIRLSPKAALIDAWARYNARTLLVVGCLIISSCEDFFDINEDPNNPTEASVGLLLTSAQLAVVNSLGMGTAGLSSALSVYMHQTTRRSSIDAYEVTGEAFSVSQSWSNMYSIAAEDIREIVAIGTEQEAWHYVGVAQIMKAYMYSQVVDVWGDVPFDQANSTPETYTPQPDDDAAIYPQLFALLDEGIANLEKTSSQSVGSDDLIYGGNVGNWGKFANTVKLKLYNQLRLVQDVSGEVNTLLAEDNLIGAVAEDFELAYVDQQSPDNRNPGFIADYPAAQRTYYVSIWFYEILKGKNPNILSGIEDPRIPYYFYNQLTATEPPENPAEYRDGEFLSIYFGSTGVNQAGAQDRSQTVLGMYPYGGRYDDGSALGVTQNDAPGDVAQRLLTYADRLYIEAELAQVGITAGDARALLQQAIQASFDKVNSIASSFNAKNQRAPEAIPQENIDGYIASVLTQYDAGDASERLAIVMTQKWIASFGHSVDQYTDYRRTGFPRLYDPNTDELSFTNASRAFPNVLPYSSTEVELNPNIQQQNPAAVKVFWDVD